MLCVGPARPPHLFTVSVIQVPWPFVCACLNRWKVQERKKRKTVVVSCFGDSATHFHLKDEGDRLLLLASAKVQKNKKWRASQKFVLALSERKKKPADYQFPLS